MTVRRRNHEVDEQAFPESDAKLREALETARQERDKARRYLDIVADLVVSLDRNGRITLINRAGCQILGYNDSELIGKHWFTTCLPVRVYEEARVRFRQVIAGEEPIIAHYQNYILTRTGEERLIAWYNTVLTNGDGKIVGTLSSGEDITERRRTEEVVSAIAQGTSATVGKAFFQPLVRCLAETLGMHYAFVGEVAERNAQRVVTCARYANGEFLKNVEYDLADTACANVVGKCLCCYPSGVQAQFPRDRILVDIGAESYVGTPLFDSTGRALGLLVVMDQAPIPNPDFAGSVLQIFAARAAAELERTRAEQALSDSEVRYRTLVESSPYCIHEIGLDGHLIAMNPAGLSMLGARDEGEIVGRLLWDFVTPAHRPRVERLLNRAFAGRPADFEFNTTHDRIYQSSFVPIHDARGAVVKVMGLTIDITERKQAEEQARLHHAELAHFMRVSVASELATGLAHELNQPLTAVVNSAQSALNRLRSDTGVRQDVLEAIELASAQALRAAEMIRRLARFVQKRQPQRTQFAINDAVREVVGFTAAEVRDQGIMMRLDLSIDHPAVLADIIQIQQVILNLVRNGIEAMSEMRAGQRLLQIQTSVVGDAIEVAVCDRGPGLTPETRERLFTPFYTTKPHGMGMGLSISRSIIDAYGGKLWATPNPEGGTTFRFTLPLANGAIADENRSDRVRCG